MSQFTCVQVSNQELIPWYFFTKTPKCEWREGSVHHMGPSFYFCTKSSSFSVPFPALKCDGGRVSTSPTRPSFYSCTRVVPVFLLSNSIFGRPNVMVCPHFLLTDNARREVCRYDAHARCTVPSGFLVQPSQARLNWSLCWTAQNLPKNGSIQLE